MRLARTTFVLVACLASLFAASYADRSASGQRHDQAAKADHKPERRGREAAAEPKIRIPLPKIQPHARGMIVPEVQLRPRVSAPPNLQKLEFGNPRHRGSNPARVAGSLDPSRRNTGALDGRQVHRRP